jgi:hypothetical protein
MMVKIILMWKDVKETAILVKDIARGVNQTVWGGAEGVKKTSTIIKSSLAGTDAIIGVSHAAEDFVCKDYVCFTLDVVGSTSSVAGLVLGNIPATKSLTVVTGTITCVCRGVRYICKKYGTYWGCHVATVSTIKGLKKGGQIIRRCIC